MHFEIPPMFSPVDKVHNMFSEAWYFVMRQELPRSCHQSIATEGSGDWWFLTRKTTSIIVFLSIFILVAGCGQKAVTTNTTTDTTTGATDSATGCPLDSNPICGKDGLTYQNTCFSSLRNVGVEHIGACSYEVCSFNGQNHYVLPNILYYEDNKERPYIEIIYGTFRLQEDGNGWTFIRAINTGVSYYYNRMPEYDAKMTESGNPVTCTNTTEAPDNLKEFLKTHGKIVTMMIEGSVQNATESNLTENITIEINQLDNCKVWFDGCNTCGVVDGQLQSCTEKGCECLEPPCNFDAQAKCLEYN